MTVAAVLLEHPHVVKEWFYVVLKHQTQLVMEISDCATVGQRAKLSSTIWDATDFEYWQTGFGPKTGSRWILVLKKENTK